MKVKPLVIVFASLLLSGCAGVKKEKPGDAIDMAISDYIIGPNDVAWVQSNGNIIPKLSHRLDNIIQAEVSDGFRRGPRNVIEVLVEGLKHEGTFAASHVCLVFITGAAWEGSGLEWNGITLETSSSGEMVADSDCRRALIERWKTYLSKDCQM